MTEATQEALDQKASQDTSSDKKDVQNQDDPLKKIEQKFGSWIGRVEAQQKKDRETILSKIEEAMAARTNDNNSHLLSDDSNPAMKALNDKLSERALSGDFFGAVDEALATRKKAEDMLRIRSESQVEKAIQGMENVKYFKEVEKELKVMAKTLVGQGYSPQDAVAFAYEKSRADHLDKLVSHGTNEDIESKSLDLLDGGSRTEDAGSKKGKLNADGKKAWEKNKNIRHGGQLLFKDENDWINQMSPRVRERYIG